MDERRVQFGVGVLVVATIIATVIMVLLFGEAPTWVHGGTYTLYIHISDAPGVTKDTPIRKSGIVIGRVTDVSFAEDGDGVIITAKIDGNRKIPRTDVCRISNSLLGDASVEFVSPHGGGEPASPPSDGNAGTPFTKTSLTSFSTTSGPAGQTPPEKGRFLAPNETVRGVVGADPIQVVANLEGSLAKAVDSVSATSNDLGNLVRQVNTLLSQNEARINRIIAQTDETTRIFQETLNNINSLVGDEQTRQQLKQAIAEAPALLRETQTTLKQMGETMTLVDKNLNNIAGFTEPLGQMGEPLMRRLNAGAEKLDRLMGDLLVFSKSLNNPNGTLGRLMNDPQLYESVTRAIENVEELTIKLRPIVDDARVFSDKIARHPETLGVRGALERKPGIK